MTERLLGWGRLIADFVPSTSDPGIVGRRGNRLGYPRDDFLEKLQPFPGEVLGKIAQAGGVAARPREGGHNSGADGIGVDRKYDRDRPGRLLQNQDRGRSARYNDIHLEGDKLGGQRREAIGSAFRRSELKGDVLAFHITDVVQPSPERLNETGSLRAE